MADQQAEASEPEQEQGAPHAIVECVDVTPEMEQRAWVRACLAAINTQPAPATYSERVQLARDLATIAACERLRRIFNSDVEPIE